MGYQLLQKPSVVKAIQDAMQERIVFAYQLVLSLSLLVLKNAFLCLKTAPTAPSEASISWRNWLSWCSYFTDRDSTFRWTTYFLEPSMDIRAFKPGEVLVLKNPF